MDTEFVWNRSYFPNIGIVQIGLSPEKSFILDAAVLKECPLSFREFLTNENVMKVCHDAYQDIQIINYYTKTTAKNIMDTQLIAAFVGLGKSISLNDMVELICNKSISKTHRLTNWINRPLTDEQFEYALEDVRYLNDCTKILIEIAKKQEVWDWILDECKILSQIHEPFALAPAVEKSYFKEVRMVAYKNRPQLYRLCFAVENMARKKNLPRSFLFKPGQLAEIINSNPENPENLKKTSITLKNQERYGKFIAQCVHDKDIPVDEELVCRKLSFKSENSVLVGVLTKEVGEMFEKASNDK
jgi:ribonuclease D